MNRNTLRNLIFAAVLVTTSARSFARTFVSITVAPPALRVYAQPPCPGEGYIWTPGYWAYGAAGYAWVLGPGCWRRNRVTSLLLDIGVSLMACTSGIAATGAFTSAITVA